jgi:hypothetical protein
LALLCSHHLAWNAAAIGFIMWPPFVLKCSCHLAWNTAITSLKCSCQ